MMNDSDLNWMKDADGAAIGKTLQGFGTSLLVRDALATVDFLKKVFLIDPVRAERDFVIIAYHGDMLVLHPDHTYGENPLPSLLPELGPRGGGIELRLYHTDPDDAEARAIDHGFTVLRGCENRPHGLRECYILDADGYCWVPSRPLKQEEKSD